ncbi:hypothetical protein FOWG_18097 [Fusarium oxysporum f. sp. lycopersici MN25]|nr:hypothetical protein FOWG_18097 [Fusarium oxysporum f. sp. lycopersici MN25]
MGNSFALPLTRSAFVTQMDPHYCFAPIYIRVTGIASRQYPIIDFKTPCQLQIPR